MSPIQPNLSQAFANLVSAFLHFGQAIFQAILALTQELLNSLWQIIHALTHFVTELTQGVFGFVFANFFLILVVGGLVYWYTQSQGGTTKRGRARA